MTETKVFHNFVLIDGKTPQARSNCWLEVTNGHIQSVGEGTPNLTNGSVNLGGRVVIPGLIDAHVHLGADCDLRGLLLCL